jgi:hypothetical protein
MAISVPPKPVRSNEALGRSRRLLNKAIFGELLARHREDHALYGLLGDWCFSRNRRNDIVEKGSFESSEMQIVADRASCAEAILSVPVNT